MLCVVPCQIAPSGPIAYRNFVGDRQGRKPALGSTAKDLPFNMVLPPIRTEIRRAIEATNAIVALIQQYHNPQNEEFLSLTQAEFEERLLAQHTIALKVG